MDSGDVLFVMAGSEGFEEVFFFFRFFVFFVFRNRYITLGNVSSESVEWIHNDVRMPSS